MTYQKNERPIDILIIPLFVSIVFICFAAILIILSFGLDPISLTKLSSDLGNVSFPLALFGVGVSLFYFVEAQFSSDKKLDQILTEIKTLQDAKCESPSTEQKQIEYSPTTKDDSTITEEDKLITQHLFERHRISLSSGDAVDLKLAQMIALNGLILSFILIKSPDVQNLNIYIFGIAFLIGSIFIGILGYRSTDWCAGANARFFKEFGTKFSSKDGIKKIIDILSDDIQENKETLRKKSDYFNIMLYFNIIGLVMVVIGYYV